MTLILVLGSMIFAFPIGVMAAIYLNEYVKDGWIKRFIKLMTNNLAGIPSIVFGLFGMALFVNKMEFVVKPINNCCLSKSSWYNKSNNIRKLS